MKSQYKSGAVVSYIAFAVSVVISFVLSPFLLAHLGNELNGLYNTLVSFSVYFAMMDLGLGTTIIRFVAKYRAEGQEDSVYSFLTIIRKIYMIICFTVFVVGCGVAFAVPSIFANSIPEGYNQIARIVFVLSVLSMIVTIYGNLYYSTVRAYEQFFFARFTAIVQDLLRVALILLLLSFGFSIVAVAFSDFFSNLLIMMSRMLYAKKKLKIRFVKANVGRNQIKEIFGYSFYIIIYSFVHKVFWQLDKVVLGIMSGGLAVTIYSLGAQISSSVESVSSTITSMYVPHAVKVVSKQKTDRYLEVAVQMGRYQLLVMTPVLVGFVLYGKEFISLWVGKDYCQAYYITIVLIIALVPVMLQSYGEAMLKAMNEQKFYTVAMLTATIFNIILTICMVPVLGALGAALASAIVNILRCSVMAWYFQKKLSISVFAFIKKAFSKIWIALVFVYAVGKAIDILLLQGGWGRLILKIILFVIVYAVIVIAFVLNDKEKELFTGMLRKLRKIIGHS